MLPFTINLAPLILTIATGFGILVHDAHIDQAVATVPASGYVGANQPSLRNDDHPHTETIGENIRSLTTNQPRLQSRFTDEKKYLTPKKVFLNTTFDELS